MRRYRTVQARRTSPEEGLGELTRLALSIARSVPGGPSAGISAYRDETLESLAWSSPRAKLAEQTQMIALTSPGLTAARSHEPVHVTDLASSAKWDDYATELGYLGIRAVLCHPVALERTVIGVVSVYADRPGGISSSMEQAVSSASVAAAELIARSRN
ncbi:GAF domain-containing protein [Nocardia sp. NPDC050712]|uniref:GAF domain-containing protein n=1 Tax=Nocardia sp. NPDC050712 TaxID=3155518 RepID=UPI0033CA50B5